jgi:hypothetical protein
VDVWRCYHPLVPRRPEPRISRPRGLFAPPLACPTFIFLVALLLAGMGIAASRPRFSAQSSAPATASTPDRLGDHYLLLVNTAVASQMDAPKLEQFDRSPYDGLAVSFADAYDTSPDPSLGSMNEQVARWKKSTAKTIWPWIYLNRMIGANDAEGNPFTKVPYFQKFPGLDLDGKAGARNDFLENWRNAVALARLSGVPGVVCDLEFYNNYKAYDVAELARMRSLPQAEVLDQLRQLGTRMADIAAARYPGATLWFLFTGFTRSDYRVIEGKAYYLAATYIVEGLLDQIRRRHFPLRVLSGGEVGLGYCHTSVDDLRQAIEKRRAAFAPLLQKYGGILELAGTMTLWSDRSAKKNWVASGACGSSSAATVEDLVPYMEVLFRSYRYNWLYGSPNGGYLAFHPASAPRFDAAIAQAQARAYGPGAGRPGP